MPAGNGRKAVATSVGQFCHATEDILVYKSEGLEAPPIKSVPA